jgi:putative toxin-antitoxin system antitoxin component (TIGR02293 family)
MPLELWHNVYMSQGASARVAPQTAFQLGWEAVEKGVPLIVLEEFAAYAGFAVKDLLEVVIPARTLKHRRERREPLSLDESDRLARVARIYELSVRVFGDSEKARSWLTRPKLRFDARSPLSMVRTEAGGRRVEEWLIQIDEGMFV